MGKAGVLSPLLANIALNFFDWHLDELGELKKALLVGNGLSYKCLIRSANQAHRRDRV
jgi:hypothetical protein